MHVIDDTVLSAVYTNEARIRAIALEQRTVQRMPGDCVDLRSHGPNQVPFTATNVVPVDAIGTRMNA
jgi:hypothetical protein